MIERKSEEKLENQMNIDGESVRERGNRYEIEMNDKERGT